MLQAMFSGISGLQVHQTRLDVIGNNISNVNTIGYKSQRAAFADQLSLTLRSAASPTGTLGGQNPQQIGIGVELASIDTLHTQGNLQVSGKATDLAIQGNGFFLVGNGPQILYTRDGSFSLDSNGTLVNSATGLKLLGFQPDASGNIDVSQPVSANSTLVVPLGSLTGARPTTSATFSGNLNANAALQSTRVGVNGQIDTALPSPPMSQTIYDSLGNPHTLLVKLNNPVYRPFGAGPPANVTQRWDVNLTLDGAVLGVQKLYATMDPVTFTNTFTFFDTTNSPAGSTLILNVTGANGAPSFPLTVDFSGLQASNNVTTGANGQGGASPVQSTQINLAGNMTLSSAATITNQTTAYKSDGTPYTVTTVLSNPTLPAAGPTVPVGAAQQWDMRITVSPPAGGTTVYDSSTNQESKVYFVPGQGFVTIGDNTNSNTINKTLTSTIQLIGSSTTPPATAFNQGRYLVNGFPITVDLSQLNTTKTSTLGDGQNGPAPAWNGSLVVYDSLGVAHNLNVRYTRALVGSGAPSTATGRWEWAITENGAPITDSTQPGNAPLFFDNQGKPISPRNPTVTVVPRTGGAPLSVTVSFTGLTQLVGDYSVGAGTQDGYPVGTLQNFAISGDGIINGVYSNGQTRALGQAALANFTNPAGLEKVGGNAYKGSFNSGAAQVGAANTAGRGKITGGAVEMSNVDLSSEFTNLIITQRGFQANTRIVTVVDELLQEVINLKR